jgi:hypothetical protein
MTATSTSRRDTRIDVFRALALITIFINHIPGNVFEHLTHKNFGFSDSAEAFVLISGLAAGLAYGTRFVPGSRLLLSMKALRRAAVLYITHIVLTVSTLAIFAAAATWFADPSLLEMINIGAVVTDAPRALVGLATLGHQLGYNNILSMYAVVLLMVPMFLLLGRINLWLMLGVSAAIWLYAGLWGVAPPNYPTDGVWFLNPLSWQFLFVIGLAATMHVKRGGSIPFVLPLYLVSAAYVLGSLLWVMASWWGAETTLGLPVVLAGFDKTFLSLPRLLHVLALAYLIAAVPAVSNLARLDQRSPLALLGKHSLPVFVAGTLLAMVGQVLTSVFPEKGFLFDSALVGTGLALQFALAFWLEFLPMIGWGGRPAVAPAPRAVASASPPATATLALQRGA